MTTGRPPTSQVTGKGAKSNDSVPVRRIVSAWAPLPSAAAGSGPGPRTRRTSNSEIEVTRRTGDSFRAGPTYRDDDDGTDRPTCLLRRRRPRRGCPRHEDHAELLVQPQVVGVLPEL